MINFQIDIRNLIHAAYSGVIEENTCFSPYPILFLPDKKIAFHLVDIPTHDEGLKNEYFFADLFDFYNEQGIRLIHVWEDFWIQQRAIIESRIRSILGHFIRIHARQTHVQRIDKPMLDDFLNKNHLYGSPKTKYKYGLFYKNDLVAAASFSALRTYWRKGQPFRSAELVRFANLKDYTIAGGLSKLLAYFINEQQPDDVMSYADKDWSDGRTYKLLGFECVESTPPQTFWLHPQLPIRYTVNKLPVAVLSEFNEQNKILLLDDFLIEKGYVRIFNTGNIKFNAYVKKNLDIV